jgi:hypothetical protein
VNGHNEWREDGAAELRANQCEFNHEVHLSSPLSGPVVRGRAVDGCRQAARPRCRERPRSRRCCFRSKIGRGGTWGDRTGRRACAIRLAVAGLGLLGSAEENETG